MKWNYFCPDKYEFIKHQINIFLNTLRNKNEEIIQNIVFSKTKKKKKKYLIYADIERKCYK